MQKKILYLGVLFAVLVVVGAVFFARNDIPPADTDGQLDVHSGNQNESREVQVIRIPKDETEGAIKDLELSVGDIFGEFTITKITEGPRGAEVIEFIGEETLEGSLGYGAIGAIYFEAMPQEAMKFPQIYRGLYEHTQQPMIIDFLLVRTPEHFSPEDFVFDKDGNSEPRLARVRIKNVNMTITPVDAFGSFDVASVEFLD